MSLRMRTALAAASVVAVVVAVLGAVIFGTYWSDIRAGADSQLRSFLGVFVIAGGLAIFAAMALGWFGAQAATKRLTRMAGALRLLAGQSDLSRRLPVPKGNTEMAELSVALNASLGRIEQTSKGLEAALSGQRRFLAQATLGLRRPLSSIAAALEEVVRDPATPADRREAAIDKALGEIAGMAHLVDELDLLAKMVAGEQLQRESFEWASFLKVALSRGRRLCAPRTVNERVAPGLGSGYGDVAALHELMRVLFSNIAAHTPETAMVAFEIGPSADARAVEISLSDTGPGVFSDAYDRLFDPFQGEAPGGSAGLGLAIARAAVTSHGGTIGAGPNVPSGLTIRIVLPRPEPPSAP